MKKATPFPIFGTEAESSPDRIAVNVAQLLGELAAVPNVEIVVPLLPEVLGFPDQTARHSLFQRFDRHRECFPLRLGEHEVNMLGHNHIAVDTKPEAAPDPFQSKLKGRFARIGQKPSAAVITAKSDEVSLPRVVEALQSGRHESEYCPEPAPLKPKAGLNGPPRGPFVPRFPQVPPAVQPDLAWVPGNSIRYSFLSATIGSKSEARRAGR